MPMHSSVKEFLEEQTQGLAELADRLRKERIAAARRAATESAARVRELNARVRELARSGVRLTSISQSALQDLIELQAEIVTTAIGDASTQLRRLADTESVRDLARQQAEVLQATRERIVADIARATKILKGAAGDVREVAAGVRKPKAAAPRKTAARAKAKAKTKAKAKVKRAVRKGARKTARRARRRA
jgi:colicin import membrane protein